VTLDLRRGARDPQIFGRRSKDRPSSKVTASERLSWASLSSVGHRVVAMETPFTLPYTDLRALVRLKRRRDTQIADSRVWRVDGFVDGLMGSMRAQAATPGVLKPLVDPFARAITYLRVSVTDRCDFRCVYCMSEDMTFLPKRDLLTLEELDRLCSVFVERGVRKLRITGGEPLVRRNIMTLFSALSRHLATAHWRNSRSPRTARSSPATRPSSPVTGCGASTSRSTPGPSKLQGITRWGEIDQVFRGLDAAQAAGLRVKINAWR
jgi:hypothetical protein